MDFVITHEEELEHGIMGSIALQCLEAIKNDCEAQGMTIEEFFNIPKK